MICGVLMSPFFFGVGKEGAHFKRTRCTLFKLFSTRPHSFFSFFIINHLTKRSEKNTPRRTRERRGFWSFEGLQNTKHEQLTPDVLLRFKFTFRFVHLGALLARFLISFWFEKKQFLFAKTKIFRAFFREFFFLRHFRFCVASLFLHKSSSFFFESVTREEQNPIRTP